MADLLSQVSDWLYVCMYVCMYVVYKANWLTTLNVCVHVCTWQESENGLAGEGPGEVRVAQRPTPKRSRIFLCR